jgi:hypothetical protein
MTNTGETTLVPVPLPTAPAQLTALERYGRSGGDLYGDLLKFSGKTGVWTAGAQGIEIPIGSKLVAIVPEMLAGFVKWVDGELVEQAMQPITETYDPKTLRASLGDLDPAKWPRSDDDGRPEDPWKEAAYLPLKDLVKGAKFTYSTSSVGGTRAVKQLVATYAWQIRAAPETTAGHLPVVELGARSYKHPDRKRGTIFNPVLTGIDWVAASAVADKSDDRQDDMFAPKAEPANGPPFEDHRSEKAKKRRNRKASL